MSNSQLDAHSVHSGGFQARPMSANVRRPTCTKTSQSVYFNSVKLDARKKSDNPRFNSVNKTRKLTNLSPSVSGFEPIEKTGLMTFNLGRTTKNETKR